MFRFSKAVLALAVAGTFGAVWAAKYEGIGRPATSAEVKA